MMNTFASIQSSSEDKDAEHRPFIRRVLGFVPEVSIAVAITLLFGGVIPVHAVSNALSRFGDTSLVPIAHAVDWVADPMVGLVSSQSPLIANWFVSLPHDVTFSLYLGSVTVVGLWLTSLIVTAPLGRRTTWRDIASW